jgi:hypothetical protein
LARHEQSVGHERQLAINAGKAVPPTPPGVRAARKSANKAKKLKKYFCEICEHAFASPARLEVHKQSARHEKKAALAANSSPDGFMPHFWKTIFIGTLYSSGLQYSSLFISSLHRFI